MLSTSFMSFDASFIFQVVFKREFFASSGFFDDLIILITLSIFSTLTDNPNNIWTLSSAFFRSNLVLLITTSCLNFKKLSKKSLRLQVLGFWSTIANELKPKEDSIAVCLYNCLLTVSGSIFLLRSIDTLMPSLFDSSLISVSYTHLTLPTTPYV